MGHPDQSSHELGGLLAIGSSRCWSVSIDEFVEREEWSLEIEGPQTYLVFQLKQLNAVPEALHYLKSKLEESTLGQRTSDGHGLILGHFGPASVSLHWDNEDFPRCFIVIGPKARSTLRVTLEAEDIRMLIDALGQANNNLQRVVKGQL